jgi:Na+-transporting NADH:ubiquinone oxidoreductase subunit NqrD
MKNKSSFFIQIILQCNIITSIRFILHVRIMSRFVLHVNKVIQATYYICTFGLLERENVSIAFQFKRE